MVILLKPIQKVDAIEFTLTQNGKSMTVKGFRKTGWEGEDY